MATKIHPITWVIKMIEKKCHLLINVNDLFSRYALINESDFKEKVPERF